MFYFEVQNKTFAVKFLREGVDNHTTIAELYEVENGELVHTGLFGIASVYYKDQFQKKVGRKVALTNLLESISMSNEFYPLTLTREDRTEIWAKYFEHFKK